MESIFTKKAFDGISDRVRKLTPSSGAAWGKMNITQMLHHLNLTMEAPLGKLATTGKPVFFMRMFRGVLYSDKPFSKGSPTPKDFKITTDTYNFEEEKAKVLNNLAEIFSRGIQGIFKPHVFFGELTTEQWGKHFYKHADHHLRQFGV